MANLDQRDLESAPPFPPAPAHAVLPPPHHDAVRPSHPLPPPPPLSAPLQNIFPSSPPGAAPPSPPPGTAPPPPPPPPRPPLIHPRGFPGFPGGLQLPLGELQSMLKERFSFSRPNDSEDDDDDIEDDTPIMMAASSGDLPSLLSLLSEFGECEEEAAALKKKRALNKRDRFGCTALRLAARGGHSDCILALVEAGADVNLSDVKAQTPLFIAIASNHLECARILLQAGAHPDGSRDNLSTPLYMCANAGWLEGLELLIEWGASLNRPPYHSASFLTSPLHIALAYGNRECFESLLLAGADPDHLCERTRAKKMEKSLQEDIPRRPSPQRVRVLTCPSRGGLAQLPLYHVAIRHGRGLDFLRLIFEFGANPWLKDDKGQAAADMENVGEEEKEFLQQIQKTPHTLLSLCRLHIRSRALSLERLHRLDELRQFLPVLLVDYLRHNRKFCVAKHAHPNPL